MAYNFLPCDRDQAFLMPPSVAEWLPEDHLAWFVLDVVGELDLQAIYAAYREDGWGRAAHDPEMMVALLLYAYCIGERSSRRIERRCHEDVAFRVVCANQTPDHATVARFRRRHEGALAELLVDSIALCARAGLVSVGTVAVDGTPVDAHASPRKTVDRAGISRRIERILQEAEEADRAEDDAYGDARGDELPQGMRRRADRVARLRELKTELEREDDARHRAREELYERYQQRKAAGRARGHPPKPPDEAPPKPAKANTTDPDSRLFQTHRGWAQGYNAQAVVSADQVILHAEAFAENDVGLLEGMLEGAKENLEGATGSGEMGVALADAGYYSDHNATLQIGPEILIATGAFRSLQELEVVADEDAPSPDPPEMPPERPADIEAALRAEGARRAEVMRRWDTGELDIHSAVAELGITNDSHAYKLRRWFHAGGEEALVPRSTEPLKLPRKPPVRDWMNAKLATERGRALYKRRAAIAEPVFGQIKSPRGFRQFLLRGLEACDFEWKFAAITHNLLKAWRSGWRPKNSLPAIA